MDKDITRIIEKYYTPGSKTYKIFYPHCLAVTSLALKIATSRPGLNADRRILKFSGMLHDIGIFLTNAPDIGCYGDFPYLAHGYKGRELLEKDGLKEIAPVCERHIGVGITLDDIVKNNLPLPKRDMIPITVEERIICYADKFYSKSARQLGVPKPLDRVRKSISRYGPEKWIVFEKMMEDFGTELIY